MGPVTTTQFYFLNHSRNTLRKANEAWVPLVWPPKPHLLLNSHIAEGSGVGNFDGDFWPCVFWKSDRGELRKPGYTISQNERPHGGFLNKATGTAKNIYLKRNLLLGASFAM